MIQAVQLDWVLGLGSFNEWQYPILDWATFQVVNHSLIKGGPALPIQKKPDAKAGK
jgi:hypothetical protein